MAFQRMPGESDDEFAERVSAAIKEAEYRIDDEELARVFDAAPQ